MRAKSPAIKGVIFDLDGTLIDSIPYHFRAFRMLLHDYGFKIPAARIKKLMGMSTLDILHSLDHVKKSGLRLADLREERHYYYFRLLGERNVEFGGAERVVRALQRKGLKVAVATASSNAIYFHSTSAKFRKLFRTVITIDDVAKGKPAPDCFLLAAAEMGLRPAECIAVGDSKYDLVGAGKAGMGFIGVLSGAGKRKELGRLAVKSIMDVPRVIAGK